MSPTGLGVPLAALSILPARRVRLLENGVVDNLAYADAMAPVPPPLRRALIEAMGGWGPFTVREIANLFEDYEFTESGDVEPEQGVRRTTAAEYLAPIDWEDPDQRGRLLELIEAVLDHYPEHAEDAGGVGTRLRRVLNRVQLVPEAAAGAQAAAFGEPERTTDPDDPFDVWPPGRIRLFFSHTAAHRDVVGSVAAALENWPFVCFVAHEEIEPSLVWKEVIESALSTCQALIAFVSEDFRTSNWCDQEVGWALGRGLVVIPVHLGVDPHGFAGSIQAVPSSLEAAPGETAERIASAITTAVFRGTRPGSALLLDSLTDAIIDQFSASPSFDLTRRRFEFLRRIPRAMWTPERRVRVDAACAENRQIREAGLEAGIGVPDAVRGLWA